MPGLPDEPEAQRPNSEAPSVSADSLSSDVLFFRNGRNQLPKGFFDYSPEFTAALSKLETALRTTGNRFGFESILLSPVEQLRTLNPLWDSESRMFVFADRANRRLNLTSNSIIAVSNYWEGLDPEKRPDAVQFMSQVFRYRHAKYRAFHQYCFEIIHKDRRGDALEVIGAVLGAAARIIPGVEFRTKCTDAHILRGILCPTLSPDEASKFLYLSRFDPESTEALELIDRLPPEQLQLWREVRGRAWGVDDAAQLAAILPPELHPQLTELFKFTVQTSAQIDFCMDFGAAAVAGIYFRSETVDTGQVLIDGGEFANPSSEKDFKDFNIIGLAFGVEAALEGYGARLIRPPGRTYIYVERDRGISLEEVYRVLEEQGLTHYVIDLVPKDFKRSMRKAEKLGYGSCLRFTNAGEPPIHYPLGT